MYSNFTIILVNSSLRLDAWYFRFLVIGVCGDESWIKVMFKHPFVGFFIDFAWHVIIVCWDYLSY